MQQSEVSLYQISPKSVKKFGNYTYKFIQALMLITSVKKMVFPCQRLVKVANVEFREKNCGWYKHQEAERSKDGRTLSVRMSFHFFGC